MSPKAKIRTERVWTYLPATLRDRLSSFCAASNITERAVFEAAIEQYISGTTDMTLVLRRIERLYRAADRVHEDVELLQAAFTIFVQLWFAHHPSPREELKPAAREEAESRYQHFKDYVTQEFAGGRRLLEDLPREAVADDAELEAMAANVRPTGAA
ncbi:MAG: hypothetical protein ACRENE_01095 [Polyangiaceae bacterium]